ncbi:MAG: LysE family transporter [Dehalococcoidia bacterium]|nr:LysE family transporter [Dehalococcoidia bacterium]
MDITSLPLIFITALSIAFTGALAPGPLLAVTITETVKRGFWAGPLLVLGHMLTEIVIVFALAMGLGKLMENNVVSGVVGLTGGVMLLVMGASTILKRRKLSLPSSGQPTPQKTGILVLTGAVASISNPYWFIWWITIGAALVINALKMGVLGIIVFFIGHILGDLIWYSVVSGTISRGRKIMSDRMYHGLMIGCGILIIGMGIYYAISGFNFLF